MYCNGNCIYLDERKHKCECTGERLAYMKYSGHGINYTVHEHNGVCENAREGAKENDRERR